jgi:hypothetical protein
MRARLAITAICLPVLAWCVLGIMRMPRPADAAPVQYSQVAAANFTRPCSYTGETGTTLTITSTAATTSAMASGVVRMVCSTAVHFRVSGTSGPTAGTGHPFLPANTVEWFLSTGSGVYVSAVRNSADGTCYLSECE